MSGKIGRRKAVLSHSVSELVQGLVIATTFPLVILVSGSTVAEQFIVATSLLSLIYCTEFNLSVSTQRILKHGWLLRDFKVIVIVPVVLGVVSTAILGGGLISNSRVSGAALGGLVALLLPFAAIGRGILRWVGEEAPLFQVPMIASIFRTFLLGLTGVLFSGSSSLIVVWLLMVMAESVILIYFGLRSYSTLQKGFSCNPESVDLGEQGVLKRSLLWSGISSFTLVIVTQFDRILLASFGEANGRALMLYSVSLFAGLVRVISSILRVIQSSIISQRNEVFNRRWSYMYDRLIVATGSLFIMAYSFKELIIGSQRVELVFTFICIILYRSALAVAGSSSLLLSSRSQDRFLVANRFYLLVLVVFSLILVRLNDLFVWTFALSGLFYLSSVRRRGHSGGSVR